MLITAMPSAPDCDMKAMRPSGGYACANVPLSLNSGSVLMTPMQFGPIMRIPVVRHTSTSSCWRARPSSPVSPKPAEITTIAFTPFSPHSRTTSSTCAAGTTTNASSTSPGISFTSLYATIPCTAALVGLTGYTTPVNGCVMRFRSSRPPIVVGSRDAPITATERASSTRRTAFAAASRSRSSYCSSVPSVLVVGNSTSIVPGRARIWIGNPVPRKT